MMKKNYYTKSLLKMEAQRCLGCLSKPCMMACPVGCDPLFFIKKTKEEKYEEAAQAIRKKNPLGEICGLVCPEKFCMKACVRSKIDCAVNIKKIQATLLHEIDQDDLSVFKLQKGKIAVIGGGPAGIGAAVTFSKNGFACTLFEESEKIGGMVHLIPKSKLPKDVVDKEINYISSLPFLSVQTNTKIENPLQLLKKGYDYIVIATGEKMLKNLDIEGEENALACFDFLKNPSLFSDVKKVAIIGGGNVALDCAKVLKENGADEVEMFVRRPFYLMKIEKERVLELIEDEINIHPMTAPIKIEKTKENKFSLTVARTVLKENKPVKTDENSFYDGFDLIIKATGGISEPFISHKRLFYVGDCKTGPSTVVEALADGIQTAYGIIDTLLKSK